MRRRDFISRLVPASVLATYVNMPQMALASSPLNTRAPGRRYIGIPLPTDPVPAAIMPTMPTGADFTNHEWINTYDPLTAAVPNAPSVVTANEYVVNKFHASATNSNEGDNSIDGIVHGTTDRPRLTIPSGSTFAAGTKIFIYGENSPLPTTKTTNRKVDYDSWQKKNTTLRFNGTSAAPCWIIGIGKPRLRTERLTILNSTHLLFDGVYLEKHSKRKKGGNTVIRSSNYLTFRNGGQYGFEVDDGGSAFTIVGAKGATSDFIVYYNNEMAYHGDFDVPAGTKVKRDFHGWRPLSWCRWLWCLDNRIHHISADACQVNNSNDSSTDASKRPHYVYFAGNEVWRLKENMFDAKNSYHCIVSENYSHSTEESAMIMPNNSEGPLTGYHWAIANRITQSGARGTGSGIRGSGNEVDNYTAVIGNFIYDIPKAGLVIANQTTGDNVKNYFVNNTVVRCATGFSVNIWQPALNGWEVDFHGNIIYDCDTEIDLRSTGDTKVNFRDNVLYDPSGSETIINERDITSEGNTSNKDPRFIDPTGNDPAGFVPQPGGSAVNGTSEHQVFRDFQKFYGLDIRKDILGFVRAANGRWDIGALEFDELQANLPGKKD